MTVTHMALLSAALLIITVLAAYAWHLTRQVREAEQQQADEQAQAAHNLRQHQLGLLEDIRFIARSVLAEQCEITEGVMRLHFLITSLDPDSWQLDELSVVRQHHQATAAMPILEAYKALPKKEQFRLDQERFRLEDGHKEGVLRELRWLTDYAFPTVTLLQ